MHYTSRRMSDQHARDELGAVLHRQEEYAAREAEEFAAWTEANRDRWTEEYARSFTAAQRRKAAKEGAALPDGSYPIYTQEDVNNAAGLSGSGAAAKSRIVAHIKKRARQLGLKLPPSIATA